MIKKLGSALLLAAVSSGVMAAWERAGHSIDLNFYVDIDTIRISQISVNIVRMWDLRDYKKAVMLKSGAAYWSVKNQNEYDCEEEKFRSIHFSLYGEKMGGGKVIYANNDVDNWSPIPPGSLVSTSWKVACGKV